VRVNVTDSAGAPPGSATLTLSVFATLAATAHATPSASCGATEVNFSATVVGGAPPYAYSWQFSDAPVVRESYQVRNFTDVGWHNATVTVFDSGGAMLHRSVSVLLEPCAPATPMGPVWSGLGPWVLIIAIGAMAAVVGALLWRRRVRAG
jgi:hypothetical protein